MLTFIFCVYCCDNNFESGQYTSGEKSLHVPVSFSIVAVTSNGQLLNERICSAETDFEAVRSGGTMFVDTLMNDEKFYKDFLRQVVLKSKIFYRGLSLQGR